MNNQQPNWLRGSLPTWIAAGLLGIIGWGAREAYFEFRGTIAKAVDELHSQDKRILTLENWRDAVRHFPKKEGDM